MKHKNVPTIRFKGFQNEWDLRILGEIGYTYSGLSGKTKEDFGFGDGRFVTYMNVFANVLSDIRKIEKVQIDKTQNLVKYGDILFTTSSETPEEVGMSSVWLHKIDNIYLNSFCFGYRPTFNLNHHYLAYYLRSSSFRKKIILLAQGISRYNISKVKVMDIFISIPLDDEQTQIGNFFKTLDEQINLQEQKHQKLINLKKAMLEKMFPKEGADIPEIRFKGFTEKWEEKKLIDYLEVSKDKNKNLEYSKNDVLSVSGEFGIVNQIALQGRSFAGASVANYGIVRIGEIVYTKSPLKKNPFGIIKTNRFQTGIVSTLYAIYSAKNNVDSTFVEYYFAKDDRLNRYLNPLISKGAKNDMKVSDENALKGKVIFPKSKEEQKCIAKYFTQLDNLINVSTEQLNKFKNIKQALLQKMFV